MTRLAGIIAAIGCAAQAFATSGAELVFLNGAAYPVNESRSWASAVVVSGEEIAYVGDDATARTFIGPGTRVIDLKGRMLLPGFQDSHVHPADAPNPVTSLDLHGLTTKDRIFQRIRQYAKSHPDKAWIVGSGWDESAFLPGGRPTRQMLDAIVPDRPAFLYDNAGHEAWVNTRALRAAHLTAATPDPANGRIERDAAGQPSGALQEDSAMELVLSVIPPPLPEDVALNLLAALQEMSRLGITALEDAMATRDIARAYQALDRQGKLEQRTNLCLEFRPSENDDMQVQRFLAERTALAGRRLRATCVKLFLDGAYGSHTLVLLQPYFDEPKFGKGTLFIEQQRLNRLVTRLDAEGFQVHMHAEGDGAVQAGLDAFEEARRKNGVRDNRHTIAHLCLIDAADVPRFRTLGVTANMTPLWMLGDPWETVFAPRLFGPERSQRIFQTRTLLGSGVMLVWGSDWPVTGVSPLDGLETATTRRYPGGKDLDGKEDRAFLPEERVSLEQAIVAYTAAGAYLMHDENNRGSLDKGKTADLVVLEKNLFDVSPLAIHQTRVEMTVIAGKIVFER